MMRSQTTNFWNLAAQFFLGSTETCLIRKENADRLFNGFLTAKSSGMGMGRSVRTACIYRSRRPS